MIFYLSDFNTKLGIKFLEFNLRPVLGDLSDYLNQY
jgi:hypothetical protein